MSPTIYIEGHYRFYFNSSEESRKHVHVKTPDGQAKFWLEPIVALVESHGIPPHELTRLEEIVHQRKDAFENAWYKHFPRH